DTLEQAITALKEQPNFNDTAILHLHLALYAFQNTVNEVLRSHNIKPHWIFALDNLVNAAVHASITILSPKLGANLAGNAPNDDEYDEESNGITVPVAARTTVLVNGRPQGSQIHHGRDERDGMLGSGGYDCEYDVYDLPEPDDEALDELEEHLTATSGHGTISSSARSNKPRARGHGADSGTPVQKKTRWKTICEQVEALKAENLRLKEYLLESQQSYQRAFRAVLESGAFTRCLTDQLVALMERCLHEHSTPDLGDGEDGTRRRSYNHRNRAPTVANHVQHVPEENEDEKEVQEEEEEEKEEDDGTVGDRRLAEWLQTQGIKRIESQQRILREGFLYDDFLYELERNDLRRLGLR
uniref:SAM domain-containing protein n=1 Tax=Anopheles maculatus TaxID=74869 RepID=A0A182TBQ7_9DIPT